MPLLILALACFAAAPPIDPCDSLIISQTRTALAGISSSLRIHQPPATTRAEYQGTVSIEGHMMRPGDLRTNPVRITLTTDSRGLSFREQSGASDKAPTETTLIFQGRAAEQSAESEPFKEVPPDKRASTIATTSAWFPSTILQAAQAAAPSCRVGPTIEDHHLTPISFADAAGHATTIFLDPEHRTARIESLAAHPRLGDVCNWTRFTDWDQIEGVTVPRTLSRFIVQGAATLRYDLKLASFARTTDDAFTLPPERQSDIPTWGQSPATGLEFIELAPNLWSIEVAASNSRILIIERASDLVLLGAPDGDDVTSSLISALRDRFPGKPIGLASFSHHHPSPSGGLRAIAATGATIIAPAALEPYIQSLLARPTSLGSPAIPGPPRPSIRTFEHETTIDCGENSVRLIDIADRSAHAFSYTVFYFPTHRLLIEDDLGYFPLDGAARVSPRLIGLVESIEQLHIEPARLIQGWPVKNAQREVAWKLVTDLVQAERDKRSTK